MTRLPPPLAIVMLALVAQPVHAREDRALEVARQIRRHVRRLPNFRAMVAHGDWDPSAITPWVIRPTADCHAALSRAALVFEPISTRLTPIPAPVHVVGPVSGVCFTKRDHARPLIVACELAARLPSIAEIFSDHGITEVRVMSAWRRSPDTSFHRMGLALDLETFVREHDELQVERDFEIVRGRPTCEGDAPLAPRARALRELACDLASSGVLSTVITPAYSPGHRDHLHIDVRPEDGRRFVR